MFESCGKVQQFVEEASWECIRRKVKLSENNKSKVFSKALKNEKKVSFQINVPHRVSNLNMD